MVVQEALKNVDLPAFKALVKAKQCQVEVASAWVVMLAVADNPKIKSESAIYQMMKYLLSNGSQANLELPMSGSKQTMLHVVKHASVVDLLLDHGADINAVNAKGATPLHIAVLSRRLSIVKSLMNHGANAYILYNNRTANGHAMHQGFDEILNELNDRKASSFGITNIPIHEGDRCFAW